MPEDDFADLMARARAGDHEAADRIYNRYAHRVIGLAQVRLDRMIRSKEDPDDVANSVFKSFFRCHRDGKFQLDDWDSLWNVLLSITLHKCGRRHARYNAGRRDVHQEVEFLEALARDPTPEEAALLGDTVEELHRSLHERERPILTLALQGHTLEQISNEVHRTERTVYRTLKRIREKLEEMRAASA